MDVGHGQVMGSIAQDQRVTVMERTNLRHLRPDQLPEQVCTTVSGYAAMSCANGLAMQAAPSHLSRGLGQATMCYLQHQKQRQRRV